MKPRLDRLASLIMPGSWQYQSPRKGQKQNAAVKSYRTTLVGKSLLPASIIAQPLFASRQRQTYVAAFLPQPGV